MKAIIFDLDGTLLESMHIWRKQPYEWDSIAKAYKHEVVLKPGVFEFLSALRQNGIRMVLATATDRHLMEPALHRNKIHGFFEEIFTCREVGSNKETPLIYHKALDFLGLDKQDVWVFEDAYYAIKTAKTAGFKVAAVHDKWVRKFSYGMHGKIIEKEDIMEFADIYVDDYCQLAIDNGQLTVTMSPTNFRT